MAMIAVEMVLNKLASLLGEEVQLLGGVRQEIDKLRDDWESMKSFLQDAEARSESDEGIKTWVKQVRDVAYDTEDVLAEFLFLLPSSHGHSFIRFLRKGFHYIQQLRARRRVAVRIQQIGEKVKAITERRNAFSLRRNDEATTSYATQTWHDPRLASLFIDEADVVGIENPRSLLISWLVTGEQNLTTISVVGMGGLGKTTLVKKTFDSPPVKKYFDCHAWITVSKSFSGSGLLQAALKGFLEAAKESIPEGIDKMGHLQLIEKLGNYLQKKRYMVVFDDIWSINAWEAVKFAFPDCDCGSRIVFTTRISDVATAVETTGHVYHLQPLPDNEAWTLFCMKAFRGENKGICPKELEDTSLSILKKCGGLPLAIVAIGGLLSRRNKSVLEWKKVHDTIWAGMRSNSSLGSLEKILLISYEDLPYYLKCCYLYLSVFPEDYLIKRMKLVRLWVVERFVQEQPGLTMEEVAEDYLNELVSRSMIQVVRTDHFNRVWACRVHDLMREIIQLKSRDESIAMTLNERSLPLNEKVRRVAVHDPCMDFPSSMSFPSLRSLMVFASIETSMYVGRTSFSGFRFLRVLELDSAPLFEFPAELGCMIHLRYLSLRKTYIRELPGSIGKLKSLEILDLKHSLISSIPNEILHLEHLNQLRNYRFHIGSGSIFTRSHGMRVPAGIGRLRNLQKLGSIEVNGNHDLLRELVNLTQLRRLGVINLRQEDGIDLCYSIKKMKHLTGLYVESTESDEILPLDSLENPPQFLQRLYLKCDFPTLPIWIQSLQHLGKLVLQYCNLYNDPLKMLQELPSLAVLELRGAYQGQELCCDAGGYPRLKRLVLYQLKQLKCIRVEEGSMDRLRELHIISCRKLEIVPLGIEHLRDIQELRLWGMPVGFHKKIAQTEGEDFWKVQHISTITNYMT